MSHCGAVYSRHWFTRPGLVGIPTRTCVRCGAPNPKLAERLEAIGWDMAELEAHEAMRSEGRA